MVDKGRVTFFAVVLVVFVVVGASRRDGVEDVDVSFSESDLDSLGESLDDLSFDDLEGLGNATIVGVSLFDLDALGDALVELSFDDLEGITEN